MDVTFRQQSDSERLAELIGSQSNARQRDRLRAALLASQGQETLAIAAMLGRSRRFVQQWAYAYRDGGIEAIRPGKSTGRPTILPSDQEQAFKERMLAGPTDADGGVCTLRGIDARRILEKEYGVKYSLDGVYDLLHRLKLSCLVPRPTHRKNAPQAMQAWVEAAPLLSRKSKRNTPTSP